MKLFRALSAAWILGVGVLGASTCVMAQDRPGPSVKLIAGFSAGGPSDGIARSIARALEAELNQNIIVENRAGAAGTIGLQAVTDSAPDGLTIGLLANTTTTSLHFRGKKLDLDNLLTPVGRFVSTRIVLVVNPNNISAKTLPELVAHMRSHPGSTWTSAGHGGLGHLGLELFALDQKLKITHVPYKGSAPAMMDVVSGLVDGMVVDATSAMSFIQSGKLRPVVVVSTERVPSLPNLPTALEQGYTSLQIDSSMGIILPPKTPKAIVDRYRAALAKAVASEGYVKANEMAGNARYFYDAPAYKDWMIKDFDRWGGVIRDANIKVN